MGLQNRTNAFKRRYANLNRNGTVLDKSAEKIDWVSPHELKKEWRRREIFRLLIALLASHGLSFLLFFPTESQHLALPLAQEGHVLIQVQGKSLLKHFDSERSAVSLFSESGDFLSHAYLHDVGLNSPDNELQAISLEIANFRLPQILKWQQAGIVVTPRDRSQRANSLLPKRRPIYEVDF